MLEACKFYRMAAELGHVNSQFRMGTFLLQGDPVPRDIKQAIHWFCKAGEGGSGEAQFILAGNYEFGMLGTQINSKEALSRYRKAAELGIPEAQHFIGEFLLKNQDCQQARIEGLAWLHLASANGYKTEDPLLTTIESILPPLQGSPGEMRAARELAATLEIRADRKPSDTQMP
jgi:hypothetical protein